MRPYIPVSKIPNFDPSRLPFWDIYVKEGTTGTIKVGGTLAGEFTAGFSGGQRKLLLFELICQRLADQSELLIALDEPFAGVTDDFVPFIVERLNELRKKHNIILVTNDHVETLTKMADNCITVSALDRTVVKVNDTEGVDRTRAIFALSIGDDYQLSGNSNDISFFMDVELFSNQALVGLFIFSLFCHALFIASFWDSSEDQAALVLVAGGIIAYFCVNPYLLALVEWRNAMEEEAEALLHSSRGLNRALKSALTVALIFIISWAEFGVVNLVIDGLSNFEFWVAMFFDSAAATFPLIGLGIYTKMAFQNVQILGTLPFLLMIFLSTTFSPGAGVEGIKELRYLFARFYFWCMVPSVQDDMEGCPENLNTFYLVLTGMLPLIVFLFVQLVIAIRKKKAGSQVMKLREAMQDEEFHQLQISLYGEKAIKRFQHLGTSHHSAGTEKKVERPEDEA